MNGFVAMFVVGLMVFLRIMAPVLVIMLLGYILKRVSTHWDGVSLTS